MRANEDLPVEGLGVVRDIPYRLTRADALGENDDLLAFAVGTVNSPRVTP